MNEWNTCKCGKWFDVSESMQLAEVGIGSKTYDSFSDVFCWVPNLTLLCLFYVEFSIKKKSKIDKFH